MVRSTDDYELWKKETREVYLKKFPNKEKFVEDFMKYLSSRYDSQQRVYLPRKVMWYLYGKKRWVEKNNQHFWIAVIGRKGGEGKSMLIDHIMYFLDGTYDKSRVTDNYNAFLKQIHKAKTKDGVTYPAVVLDEPENKTHALSNKGRQIKDVLERVRILHLYVGACANSLSSVPSFIYERLTSLIWINNEHRFWLWDSEKDIPKHTIVDDIKGKDGWGTLKHSVFQNSKFVSRAHFKNIGFSKDNPFDLTQYEKKKEVNVLDDIDIMIKTDIKKKIEPSTEREVKEKMIYERKSNKKISFSELSREFRMPATTIRDYYTRYKNKIDERRGYINNMS